jgi:fumarylpyruvate hydrolase
MTIKNQQTNAYSLPLNTGNEKSFYPVRRIICIGRNYAEHAKEMGHNPNDAPPFFFYKPLTALRDASQAIDWKLPAYSQNVHYELELAIAIGNKVTNTNPESGICAAGLSLDMTCRDIQQNAKALGRPWETAKGFDHSAPCSTLHAADWTAIKTLGDFSLYHNNKRVQRGNIKEMIWPIPELLKQLLAFTELDYGDLILTGTPAGVGQVTTGDRLHAKIEGLACDIDMNIE